MESYSKAEERKDTYVHLVFMKESLRRTRRWMAEKRYKIDLNNGNGEVEPWQAGRWNGQKCHEASWQASEKFF